MKRMVVIATKNQGKVKEFADLFRERGIEIRSLLDYDSTALPEIVEDGATFAENAMIKARTVALYLNEAVLADDSGLVVDALHGAPGVYSARYAGEDATDADNIAKLLLELSALQGQPSQALGQGHPKTWSRARFVCTIALFDPLQEQTLLSEGACEGYIIAEPEGGNGFGYDPIFYVPEFGCTMAQLGIEQKNAISHRSQALRKLLAQMEGSSE